MGDLDVEHSAETKASPAAVWERYTDVENWSEWSAGVEEASVDGEFEAGTKGTLKPAGLPRSPFELTEVEPERGYVTQSRLPGTAMRLEHMLEPVDGGTRITHRVTFDGRLSFFWSRVVGRFVKRDLPASVDRLAELVVEKEEEARKDAAEEKERKGRLKEADEQFKEEIEKTSSGDKDAGGASLPGG